MKTKTTMKTRHDKFEWFRLPFSFHSISLYHKALPLQNFSPPPEKICKFLSIYAVYAGFDNFGDFWKIYDFCAILANLRSEIIDMFIFL